MSLLINGVTTGKKRIFLLDLLFYQSSWHFSEDTTVISLTKEEIPLNDHF